MTIMRVLWHTLRGMSLLVVLTVLFTGVLFVSCLARLALGDGLSGVAGKLHLGS